MATPDVTAVETRRTQPGSMSTFDVDAFHATPLQRKPFDYLVVPGFIRPDALAALNRDYPQIEGPGNMSADDADCGPAFAQLLATLKSEAFADLVGEQVRRRSSAAARRRSRCGASPRRPTATSTPITAPR